MGANIPHGACLYDGYGNKSRFVDGNIGVAVNDCPPPTAYTKRLDYASGDYPIYIGWALSSSNPTTASALWAIQKLTYDASGGLTLIQWADGNTDQDNIWDNRTLLTYK